MSRYEATVRGLTRRWVINRSVKKLCIVAAINVTTAPLRVAVVGVGRGEGGELAGSESEQLGGGGQIPVGGSRVAVTEIGRQRRETGLDVLAVAIPADQRVHGERVAQISIIPTSG